MLFTSSAVVKCELRNITEKYCKEAWPRPDALQKVDSNMKTRSAVLIFQFVHFDHQSVIPVLLLVNECCKEILQRPFKYSRSPSSQNACTWSVHMAMRGSWCLKDNLTIPIWMIFWKSSKHPLTPSFRKNLLQIFRKMLTFPFSMVLFCGQMLPQICNTILWMENDTPTPHLEDFQKFTHIGTLFEAYMLQTYIHCSIFG